MMCSRMPGASPSLHMSPEHVPHGTPRKPLQMCRPRNVPAYGSFGAAVCDRTRADAGAGVGGGVWGLGLGLGFAAGAAGGAMEGGRRGGLGGWGGALESQIHICPKLQ